jgi:hypothetical protein
MASDPPHPTASDPPHPTASDRPDATPLERWLAELRVADAARSRSDQAWHTRLGQEETAFAGLLAELGARGRPVVVELAGGRRHRGWVRLVGSDVIVLRTGGGPSSWRDVVVAVAAVASVRVAPGAAEEAGGGPVSATTTLVAVLSTLAGTGIEVVVTTTGGDPVVGGIEAVGRDVIVIRPTGRAGRLYVRLGSLVEASVPESG